MHVSRRHGDVRIASHGRGSRTTARILIAVHHIDQGTLGRWSARLTRVQPLLFQNGVDPLGARQSPILFECVLIRLVRQRTLFLGALEHVLSEDCSALRKAWSELKAKSVPASPSSHAPRHPESPRYSFKPSLNSYSTSPRTPSSENWPCDVADPVAGSTISSQGSSTPRWLGFNHAVRAWAYCRRICALYPGALL